MLLPPAMGGSQLLLFEEMLVRFKERNESGSPGRSCGPVTAELHVGFLTDSAWEGHTCHHPTVPTMIFPLAHAGFTPQRQTASQSSVSGHFCKQRQTLQRAQVLTRGDSVSTKSGPPNEGLQYGCTVLGPELGRAQTNIGTRMWKEKEPHLRHQE